MSFRTALFAGVMVVLASTPVAAAEFTKEQDCVVGAKVTDRENRTGTVTSVSGGMCQVALENGTRRGYLFWMLRAAGPGAVAGDKLVNGVYPCYSSTGGTLNYMFMDIQIDGPDSYRDKKGNKGKYRLDPASGSIVFESGPLTKARARLLAGPGIGLNMDGGNFFNTTCSLKK